MGDRSRNIEISARLTRILADIGSNPETISHILQSFPLSPSVASTKIEANLQDLLKKRQSSEISIERLRLILRSYVQIDQPWSDIETLLREIYYRTSDPADLVSAVELGAAYGEISSALSILTIASDVETGWLAFADLMPPVRAALAETICKTTSSTLPKEIWAILKFGAVAGGIEDFEITALWLWGLAAHQSEFALALVARYWDQILQFKSQPSIMGLLKDRHILINTAELACELGVPSFARRLLHEGDFLVPQDQDTVLFLFEIRHTTDSSFIAALDSHFIERFEEPMLKMSVDLQHEASPNEASILGAQQAKNQRIRVRAFIERQSDIRIEQLAALADLEWVEGRPAGSAEAWLHIGLKLHFRNNDLEDIWSHCNKNPRLHEVVAICQSYLDQRKDYWNLRQSGASFSSHAQTDSLLTSLEAPPQPKLAAELSHFLRESENIPSDEIEERIIDPAYIAIDSDLYLQFSHLCRSGYWQAILVEFGIKLRQIEETSLVPLPPFFEKIPSHAASQLLALIYHYLTPDKPRKAIELLSVLTTATLLKNPSAWIEELRPLAPIWLIWKLEAWILTEAMRRSLG